MSISNNLEDDELMAFIDYQQAKATYLAIRNQCTKSQAGGGNHTVKNPLTLEKYIAHVVVSPFNPKYANGAITSDYPVCPYIGATNGALPTGVTYSGVDNLTRKVPLRHWGQRKLLLTEIDFLNRLPKKKCIVIYAGAADGRHIPILVDMYPHVEFHLYDPRTFYHGLDNHHNIRLNLFYGGAKNKGSSKSTSSISKTNNQFGWFTDEVASWYAVRDTKVVGNRELYFISDIRTIPSDIEVEINNRQQEEWVRIMKPLKSMLKFRVRYPSLGESRDYKYLQGEVHLQCWAPIYSTETRLLVDISKNGDFPNSTWDTVRYERNLAWFNQIMRTYDFSDNLLRDFGIPLDITVSDFWKKYISIKPLGFDFVYELQILHDAMIIMGEECTVTSLRKLVKKINNVLINDGVSFKQYLRS
jgi:hypothetical protein